MRTRQLFLSPAERCGYLPDRDWRLRYQLVDEMTAAEYSDRLLVGWIRQGFAMFRPECPSCQRCQAIRIPVASFRPRRSLRRVWRANAADVSIVVSAPSLSAAKQELYLRYHEYQRREKGWPEYDAEGLDLHQRNPFPTEEWSYFLGGRLVGLGYVDVLPAGLSAIQFVYDPAERRRSLGIFNVLSIIAAAARRQAPHVYLGYFVEGCGALKYTRRFEPVEVLDSDGRWTLLAA